MYENSDKRKIYYILKQYKNGNIDALRFCDEFYFSYREVSDESLSEFEKNIFSELSSVASRFSPYQEDYDLDRMAFATEEELRGKILEAIEKIDLRNSVGKAC